MGDSERSCKTQKGVREARPDGLSGLLARRDGLWALTDSNRRPLPCKGHNRPTGKARHDGLFGPSEVLEGARRVQEDAHISAVMCGCSTVGC